MVKASWSSNEEQQKNLRKIITYREENRKGERRQSTMMEARLGIRGH